MAYKDDLAAALELSDELEFGDAVKFIRNEFGLGLEYSLNLIKERRGIPLKTFGEENESQENQM